VRENVGLLKSIRDYIDAQVHSSARLDALTASRHRAFIAPRLWGGIAALAAFPLYIGLRGVPSTLEVLVFSWLVLPIFTAYYLSRTGRYENAHVMSSLALAGLVTAVAAATGGIASFAAVWLVVVPLEAALSASRRVVALASSFALTGAGLLVFLSMQNWLPAASPSEPAALAALGVISAALYATGLALGTESLARTSFWLRYAEEDRYRLLARNMTDVITRHGRNGAVLFVSPAAERLLGAPVSDLVGHRLFDRVHVADRPAYLTALADAAALGESRSVEFRVRYGAADGEGARSAAKPRFVWVEMRCRPLDQAGHEADAGKREVVAILRDICERKAQEQALADARAEADRANAAKVQFLASMSHELRTPLNAIIGFSDMLIKEDKMRLGRAQRQNYARLINESGNHLLLVVNDMLDMSKMESGDFEIEPESFAPAGVISHCCDLLALKAREGGIDLVMRIADNLPQIVADKRAFKQILINLLSNAVKFTERGGRVTVSAKAGDSVMTVMVDDTGVGISADDLSRIGRPFFQARAGYDRRHDGSGLGLSIVQGLVMLHGGHLDIASRLGEGTRVTVHLPLICEGARSVHAAGNVAHPSFESAHDWPELPAKKIA
jgi:cell cycle sensor histidine kinase DivJ